MLDHLLVGRIGVNDLDKNRRHEGIQATLPLYRDRVFGQQVPLESLLLAVCCFLSRCFPDSSSKFCNIQQNCQCIFCSKKMENIRKLVLLSAFYKYFY